MSTKTILITGGASGIGRALAERWIQEGHTVIAVGRREDMLAEAREAVPGLHTHAADVATHEGRVALFEWATEAFPELDTLVNNAGIQRYPDFLQTPDFIAMQEEIVTNFEAPVHLSALFSPHLQSRPEATLVFVSSGLAFVPLAPAPVYSATKAAVHSFALSLRYQLSRTSVKVVEIAPPHVNTDLGFPGRNTAGMPLDEFADAVAKDFREGKEEITVGFSAVGSQASRAEADAMFNVVNPPL
ncbi:SDR family NAD(P)-dependent oxidoreductase [bacterium]|nr:MAG: SDR family NAD(P)-dependent oxidoreductase [bacterium]